MGRIRNRKTYLWLSDDEFEMLEKKSEYCGICRSDYLRRMVRNGVIIKIDMDKLNKAVYEINKIGTNINQIAYKLNATGSIYAEDFETLKALYNDMVNESVKTITDFISELLEQETN